MKRSRPAIERFTEKISYDGPQSPHAEGRCFLWIGNSRGGYGQFRLNGRTTQAHRAAWQLHIGPIPEGKFVCHHCDERPCVRVDHLFISDDKGNMEDAREKGRTRQWEGPLNARWKFGVRNADIERLYLAGMGCKKIGARLGLHATTVRLRLLQLGILRSRAEAGKVRARRLPRAA